jgi:RNA polymerase sigma-70 factor, ECF subfamily
MAGVNLVAAAPARMVNDAGVDQRVRTRWRTRPAVTLGGVPGNWRPSRHLPPEADLVAALRGGDEMAFTVMLDAWSPGMLRTARSFVADFHTAEDVVQETWLAVLRGLDRFEGRAALRTWTYQILINVAKARGRRDARVVPESSVSEEGPTVDPSWFQGADEPYPGHWRTAPGPWPTPEAGALDAETRRQIEAALDRLPARQRAVITLRDVEGYEPDEVCRILDITPGNQRLLLHRARASVRAALAAYLNPSSSEEGR